MALREIGEAAVEVARSITRRLARPAKEEKPTEAEVVRGAVSKALDRRETTTREVEYIHHVGHIRFQSDQGGKITLVFDAQGEVISISSGLLATNTEHREDMLKKIFQELFKEFPQEEGGTTKKIGLRGWEPVEGHEEGILGRIHIPYEVIRRAFELKMIKAIVGDSSIEIFFTGRT